MIISIECPEYIVDDQLDLANIGKCIDKSLVETFDGKKIVLRTISSQDHDMSKDELLSLIEREGYDRYDPERSGDRYENVANKHIDFFGRDCIVAAGKKLSQPLLEGFHIYGAELHGKPANKMDIWLIYDRSKLKGIHHKYKDRDDSKRDGYAFIDPGSKSDALLGILEIKS